MIENQNWHPQAIFYRVYLRAFYDSNADGHGDIQGLISRLAYIEDLGVDCIWLMPIFPPSHSDGSKGVTDFYDIQKEYGDMADFEALTQAVHSLGMRLIIDLEMNQTSDKHPWFITSKINPQSPYRNYYVWADSDTKYRDARHLSHKQSQSNWHPEAATGQFYWSRFSPALPELNYDNPEIRTEMVKVMRFWLSKGVDGFCLDGLPFLFEKEDTNCENLPENHKYIRAVRAFLNQNYPDYILLGSMNQPQQVAATYLGEENELHLTLHPSLGAQLLLALSGQDAAQLKRIIDHFPLIPASCQWVHRLTSLHGLNLEQITSDEQKTLRQVYVPDIPSHSGSMIKRRLASIVSNDQRIIRLLYALLFSLPGTPALNYGDEIGMGDNLAISELSELLTPMQWDETKGAGFSRAPVEKLYAQPVSQPLFDYRTLNVVNQEFNPESHLNFMKDLIKTRKDHPELAVGSIEWLDTDNTAVAAFIRRQDEKTLFAVYNLSDRTCGARIPREIRQEYRMDLLGGYLKLQPDLTNITLKPYQFGWFSI